MQEVQFGRARRELEEAESRHNQGATPIRQLSEAPATKPTMKGRGSSGTPSPTHCFGSHGLIFAKWRRARG
jgi:hypothetical protein